jgi:hypothetical protein
VSNMLEEFSIQLQPEDTVPTPKKKVPYLIYDYSL